VPQPLDKAVEKRQKKWRAQERQQAKKYTARAAGEKIGQGKGGALLHAQPEKKISARAAGGK
jgi:hypothetical protein